MNSTLKKRGGRGKRGRRSDTTKAEVSKFAGDAYSLAERAYRGVNHVLKLINIETKYLDMTAVGASMSNAAPVVTYLSSLAQGVNVSERVGDSLKLQGIYFGFSIYPTVTTPIAACRVVLIRDHENAGASPAWADVFNGGAVPYQLAPRNWFNTKRFSVLVDEALVINPTSFDGVNRALNISLSGHVKYRGTAAAVASAAEGSLFLIYWSSVAVLAQQPVMDWSFRMLYTDD